MLKFTKILLTALITTIPLSIARAQIPLVINELMASNSSIEPDPQGEYDDWIEIYNHGTSDVDMSGMYLTDDLSNPTKWQLPGGITLRAGDYLLIWADGATDDVGLHANFKLSAGGEEIGLFDTDGITPIDSVTFSKQIADISYGRYPDASDDWRFSELPSPTEQNNDGYLGIVEDTKFSHDRGFYDTPFEVEISTETSGATIFYTTDGSIPTETYGRFYTGPILITTTTCLRAMAFKQDFRATNVDTQTYIFLEDVIQQTGEGLPNTWGYAGADYGMDPAVIDAYIDRIIDDLKSIPTMSLVMSTDDWFNGSSDPAIGGIYANPDWEDQYAVEAERTVSVEFLDPCTTEQFQLDAGIRLAGGSSTRPWKMDKLSMRLKFTGRYGPTKLRFPLFGDDAANEFDTLVVDARMNNSWPYGGGVLLPSNSRPWISGRPTQRDVAQYTRDQFVSDIQNSTGSHGTRGRHIHLYLNGLYWGLYWLHERPDESFAASYFGGNKEDYDVLKHNQGIVVNGSSTNYREMFNIANAGLSSDSQYQLIQQYLDIPDLIGYMITNFYVGNTDWAHHNWYATFNRNDPNGRWRYHSWDAEHVMEGLYANVTGRNDSGCPSGLHRRLRDNTEYRLLFADHVHRHFFNDGILTPEGAAALYHIRLDEVDRAVVGESARWGDNHESTPRTRDIDWERERDWLLDEYFPNRTSIVFQQLRNSGLYPDIDAPVFYINGSYQHGGYISSDDRLSMTCSEGTIYYTLDGYDPRAIFSDTDFMEYTTLAAENANKHAFVPTGPVGNDWRESVDYDDSTWLSCTGSPGGVGYERTSGGNYEQLFSLNLRDQMYTRNASCYIRIPFNIDTDANDLNSLKLKIKYDDGFIAYLNGTEITRRNFDGTPTWNSSADFTNSDSAAVVFEKINISDSKGLLQKGSNLLAIHGMNASTNSSDFLISAELIAGKIPGSVNEYTEPITLTQSTKVKARTFSDGTWSALNEAIYAVGPVAENLRITEIMYHPQASAGANDPKEEFIELTNIGAELINLNLVRFTNGVDFTFPNIELAPGEYVVIVEDIDAFESRYGTDIPIAGEYSGNLNNNGERVILQDAIGQIILDFSYNDNWYSPTDGVGFSLTILEPADPDSNSWNDKDSWQASNYLHGSPGREL